MSTGVLALRGNVALGSILLRYFESVTALGARIERMRSFISLGTLMMRDAPARPGMATVLAATFVSLVVAALSHPSVAHAQLNFLDPSASVQATTSGWINQAKSIAQGIWGSLIVIEFVFFGIQFGLFRENFTEMFGSMALKIITTGFFLWLIQNADTLLPAIINSFTKSAQDISGQNGGSALATLTAEVVIALGAIFAGAALSLGKQEAFSLFSGPFVFGNGFAGEANSLPIANNISIMLMQLVAFLLAGALAVIILQWALTNIESYIVISAGIIFLGFTGSRWTLPFAQGYMSYAINVGTKLFTLYLILAVEANLGVNVLAPVAGAAAIIGADPTGAFGPAAVALMLIAAINVMIMSALAWYIPNIAGSFLSGQSSLSASNVMGSMASAISGIAVANAQRHQAGNANKQHEHLNQQSAHMGGLQSHAGQAPGAAGGGTDTGAPAVATPLGQQPGANGSSAPGTVAPATTATPVNSNSVVQSGNSLFTVGSGSPAPSAHAAPSGGYSNGSHIASAPGNGALIDGASGHSATPVNGASHGGGDTPAPSSATPFSAGAAGIGGDSPSSNPPPNAPPAMMPNGKVNPQAPAPTGGTGAVASGGTPLVSRSTAQLASLSPSDGRAAVGREAIEGLSQSQWNAIPAETRAAMIEEAELQGSQQKASAEMAQAYAMQAMVSALPRGESAPAAVQVRLSSPDKL